MKKYTKINLKQLKRGDLFFEIENSLIDERLCHCEALEDPISEDGTTRMNVKVTYKTGQTSTVNYMQTDGFDHYGPHLYV
jgi:hypothetical protein